MNGKRFSEDKARRNGFYLALAVCLVAVGIAAWSTYDAVNTYAGRAERPSQSSELVSQKNQDVRQGQTSDVDPEAPRRTTSSAQEHKTGTASAAPSSPAPQGGASQSGTPGTVTPSDDARQTAASPDPEPESGAEEPMVPTNGPIYELSSEMVWPFLNEDVAKAYSAGAPVYSETMKDWRIHEGLDLSAQAGEEVRACANGQVKETRSDSMLGNVIVVEHGSYLFSYCGVGEDFLVKEGDIVTKGQVIGTVTAVPCEAADGPHLHLEARQDQAWLDPQAVLEGRE